jgi:hypothetical protein
MSAQIAKNFTETISALIMKEVEASLLRLRGKIFKALDADENEIEVDVKKFAENTVKKIVESEDYTNIINDVKKSAESAEKKESTKEKKDPDAPKGAKNAYIFFCGDARAEVKKENPEMKSTEIVKKMGEMWKEISPKKKAVYQDMASDDKKRYAEEIEGYEPKDGFKSPKKAKKEKSDAPKRARSAYIFFCMEKREEVKKNPKISNSDILSELGKMWKALSEKKKKPFAEMAEADKKRFAEEVHKYVNSDVEDWKNWNPSEEDSAKPKDSTKPKKVEKVNKGKSAKVTKAVKVSNRTPSGYLLFCKEKRQQVKEENPSAKMTDITTILGKMWKDLSEKKKKPFMDQAAKLKEAKEAEKTEEKVNKEESDDDEDEEEETVKEESDDEEIFSDDDEEIFSDDEETSSTKKSGNKK